MRKIGWLAPKLRNRITILQGVQTPNDDGGLDMSYAPVREIWAEMIAISDFSIDAAFTRGEQTEDVETMKFRIRYSSVRSLNSAFSSGYSKGFDVIYDINPLKSEWFIKVKEGADQEGRLFRIKRVKRDDQYKAYVIIRASEIEEQGTGWPE